MQKAVQWLQLWRELANMQETAWTEGGAKSREDVWRVRADKLNADLKKRWANSDSSREFVSAKLRENPEWTALDIGGGTGAWAIYMARYASHVTVVESSPTMVQIMNRNLADADARNVEVVPDAWPDVPVSRHDLTLCSHAMYGMPDFAAFVRSVEAVTRHICVLILRAPAPDDLMCAAAMHIWGQPYDSPNFQVAYNALLQMGIFPNVIMEDTGLWAPWSHASLEDAMAEAKRRLGLPTPCEHDAFLRDLLASRLDYQDGRFVWPQSMRTALVHWTVNRTHQRGIAPLKKDTGAESAAC